MTTDKATRPEPEPPLSVTAETATMAADLMLLVAAGSDPHDKKRSILRYAEDIEPTLDALATITGQLPRSSTSSRSSSPTAAAAPSSPSTRRRRPATARTSKPKP